MSHPGRMVQVRAALDHTPGLAICGAVLDGVGVPACIAAAGVAARGVAARKVAADLAAPRVCGTVRAGHNGA